VFPVYFTGIPAQVREFIAQLVVPKNFGGYFFAIATYANFSGNAINTNDP